MDPSEFLNALPGIQVLEKIGEGQFSDVFRAKVYGEIRAIKVGKPLQEDAQFSISSLFEAQFKVQHEIAGHGSVRVFHLEDHPQHPYMIMEYLPGVHLGSWLGDNPTPNFQVCKSIVLGIIRSLHFAHSAQIYHLDLKPSNIILSASSFNETSPCPVCVFDFSTKLRFQNDKLHLSSLMKSAPGLTTPLYTAPEVWLNKDIGPWSDVYSLGIILAELFGNDPAVKSFELKIPGDAPGDIQTVIHKCLKQNVADRYQTLGELQKALLNCVRHTPKELLVDGIIEEVQWLKNGELKNNVFESELSNLEQGLAHISSIGASLAMIDSGREPAAAIISCLATGVGTVRKLLKDPGQFSDSDRESLQSNFESLGDAVSAFHTAVNQHPENTINGRPKSSIKETAVRLPRCFETVLTEATSMVFDKSLSETRRKSGFIKKRMTWVFGKNKDLARLNQLKTDLTAFFNANKSRALTHVQVDANAASEFGVGPSQDPKDQLRARWFEQPFIGYLRSFIESGTRDHLPKTEDGKLDLRYAPFQSNNFSHHQIWHNISFQGATLNGIADSLYFIDCDFSHATVKLKTRELKILRSQFNDTDVQLQFSLMKPGDGARVHSTEEPMNPQLLEDADYFGALHELGDFIVLESQFHGACLIVESPAFQNSAVLSQSQFNRCELSFAGHSDLPRDVRVDQCELIQSQLKMASRHTWLFKSSDLRRLRVQSNEGNLGSLQLNENNNCQGLVIDDCQFFVNHGTNIDCRCTSWDKQEIPPTVQRLPCDHE
ncbi:MAG: serine/threonine-protein kinase [Planctomycetota bacterium]|nr:serine/threonine-protein kinase [Planctomycetota bacterium]